MRITIENLMNQSNGMIEVQASVEGMGYAATQDFYVYPNELMQFGEKLQEFPKNTSDEVILESGSTDDRSYCWVRFVAYVYDQKGHCALEFSVQRNGARQVQAKSQFSVQMDASALNELGRQITLWVKDNDSPLVYETLNYG
jgi:hypothetical protein